MALSVNAAIRGLCGEGKTIGDQLLISLSRDLHGDILKTDCGLSGLRTSRINPLRCVSEYLFLSCEQGFNFPVLTFLKVKTFDLRSK